MQGREIYEFIVKYKRDRSSEGHFVLASKIGVNESAANFLIGYTRSRVPSIVFNLMQSVTAGSDDLRILSQDKTFLDTLEKTKKQFNNKCEILAKMRSASFS